MSADFLSQLNLELESLEASLRRDFEEKIPNIFVLGLPRSGTTLLTQVIYNNLDVGCTNNLIAKFWQTPLVGTHLSKNALEGKTQKQHDYTSYYGQTGSVADPHEFSWFWQSRLQINDITSYDIEKAERDINWIRLRNELIGMSIILNKPLIHKPLELVGYHMESFRKLFSKAIFIYIERDLKDIAHSLARARQDKCGNLQTWWGSYPRMDEYEKIKDGSPASQIAGQVFFLDRMYKEKLSQVNSQYLIKTSYDELIENPNGILDKIIKASFDMGFEMGQLSKPDSFQKPKESDRKISKEIVLELEKLEAEHG